MSACQLSTNSPQRPRLAVRSASCTGSAFIIEAASAGVESRDIMAQTGHKSETVMRGYIQDAGLGASAAVKAAFREDS